MEKYLAFLSLTICLKHKIALHILAFPMSELVKIPNAYVSSHQV